jgi:hypothetical protein
MRIGFLRGGLRSREPGTSDAAASLYSDFTGLQMQIDELRADVERIRTKLSQQRRNDPVSAMHLQEVDEALARQLEGRKRFFEALERLEKLGR